MVLGCGPYHIGESNIEQFSFFFWNFYGILLPSGHEFESLCKIIEEPFKLITC